MAQMVVNQSLAVRDYLEEFHKLDFNDRKELGNELMVNQLGYFMFDVRQLDTYVSNMHIANNLYKADKIYLNGNYSDVYAALETLIENNLHLQIKMLDIEIDIWDSMTISWELLGRFERLKLLFIDGCNSGKGGSKSIPDITTWLPASLEALSIVNMPYYNAAFSAEMRESNLKVLKMMTLKWNQELNGGLPSGLECLILESGEFDKEVSNLPGGLKRLVLLCPKFNKGLDMLPHGLEFFAGLHFNCFSYPEHGYKLGLSVLPSSMKYVLLDEDLYERESAELKRILKDCHVEVYEDLNNFEFIFGCLIERM